MSYVLNRLVSLVKSFRDVPISEEYKTNEVILKNGVEGIVLDLPDISVLHLNIYRMSHILIRSLSSQKQHLGKD